MYYLAVRQFARTLKNLDAILEKTQAYARARNFDVNNLLTERLFPDMLPFASQIRIACDHAKSASASLAAKEAPSTRTTRRPSRSCAAASRSASPISTPSPRRTSRAPTANGDQAGAPRWQGLLADEYLFGRQIPNFFFHVTTAYALLRRVGVEIGKSDFLGR